MCLKMCQEVSRNHNRICFWIMKTSFPDFYILTNFIIFPYGAYVGLHISTPEEMKRRYEQTEEKEIRDYRLKTLDEFVKSWKVKYFFNYSFKWNLRKLYKLLPGLGNLVDHGIGFVDKEGNST